MGHSDIVIGRVVGIHIKGDFITGDGVSDFFFPLFCFERTSQMTDTLLAF